MGKRILITSITSWNQKSGSNTYSTLLGKFNSDDLANIYIRPEMPDSTRMAKLVGVIKFKM